MPFEFKRITMNWSRKSREGLSTSLFVRIMTFLFILFRTTIFISFKGKVLTAITPIRRSIVEQ